MAKLSKGYTFADSVSANAAALNNLVDAATILPGAITEQGAVTPDVADSFLIYDSSASGLAKCTLQNVVDAFPTDAAAATKSLRTLGTGSQQSAAGNDSRFSASVTGIRKSAGGGSTDVAATPKDFYFTGINLSNGATIDCDAADLFFETALNANRTYTISNIRGGMTKAVQIFQNGHTVAFTGGSFVVLGAANTAGWNLYSILFSAGSGTGVIVCSS